MWLCPTRGARRTVKVTPRTNNDYQRGPSLRATPFSASVSPPLVGGHPGPVGSRMQGQGTAPASAQRIWPAVHATAPRSGMPPSVVQGTSPTVQTALPITAQDNNPPMVSVGPPQKNVGLLTQGVSQPLSIPPTMIPTVSKTEGGSNTLFRYQFIDVIGACLSTGVGETRGRACCDALCAVWTSGLS
jgi:hypothetical protein